MSYPQQSDQRTCGIAALAAFLARNDVQQQTNFIRYCSASAGDIARIQADLHKVASRVGLPWPRALGTSPWALATLVTRATGRRYRIVAWNAGGASAAIRAWEAGQDVLIYTGERAVPRHVVMLLGRGSALAGPATSDKATIFEPGNGTLIQISPAELAPTTWTGRAGKPHWGWWTRPLLAIVP